MNKSTDWFNELDDFLLNKIDVQKKWFDKKRCKWWWMKKNKEENVKVMNEIYLIFIDLR